MAQVDYFLKIEGIEGESEDSKHKKDVEVLSFSWGVSNAGSMGVGSGGGTGKCVVQDLHFTMRHCCASPKLAEFGCSGKHIPKATLVCRKAGGEEALEYLKISLSDLVVSSYQMGGSQGEVLPIDQVSLNFSKIEHQYKPQTATGTGSGQVQFGWDVKQGKKV